MDGVGCRCCWKQWCNIRIKTNVHSKFLSRIQDKTQVEVVSKLSAALLYKRMSKEKREWNPPMPNNLSMYTMQLPPSNHSSCFDVPSESSSMILHITNTTLINTTTPHHLTSQLLRPLPCHNKQSHHHFTPIVYHLCISHHLCHSVTLIPFPVPLLITWAVTVSPS